MAPGEQDTLLKWFHSLTKEVIDKAVQEDPTFMEKFRADAPPGLAIGRVDFDTLWCLVLMHVGSPVPLNDLDRAAAFFTPRGRHGMVWKIHPDLCNSVTWTAAEIKRQSKVDSKAILTGILKYKGWTQAGIDPAPMRLPFWGLSASLQLWNSGKMPVPSKRMWNLDWDDFCGEGVGSTQTGSGPLGQHGAQRHLQQDKRRGRGGSQDVPVQVFLLL